MDKKRGRPRPFTNDKPVARRIRPKKLTPSQPKSQGRIRSNFRIIKNIVVHVFAVIGFISTASGILGGPIWPTEPKFAPGAPSFAQPLDVPFSVTNTSSIFNIYNLKVSCVLIYIETSDIRGQSVNFNNTTVLIDADSGMKPKETRSYTCPFQHALDTLSFSFGFYPKRNIIKAKIGFESKYYIVNGLIGLAARSDVFTLDTRTIPPQWTRGSPMY